MNKLKQKNLVSSLLLVVLLISTFTLAGNLLYVLANPQNIAYLEQGIYPGGPTYTFWRLNSTYYVKDAYGDIPSWGISSNASYIIQTAIDNLNNSGSPLPFGSIDSNTLYFSNAIYELDTQIQLPRNIRLVGERGAMVAWDDWHGTQLRIADGENIGCILNITMAAVGQTYIRIEDLVFHGNNASGATGYGIYIQDSKRIAIENCEFRLFANSPIYADNWEVGLIRDSYFHQFDEPAFRSITWLGAFYFEHNDVTSYAGSSSLEAAIHINGTGAAIYFMDNDIYGSNDVSITTDGILIDMDNAGDSTENIFLTNNNFGDFEGGNGTTILGNVEGVIILGNRFRDLVQPWAFGVSGGNSPTGIKVAYNVITSVDQFQSIPNGVDIEFNANYGYTTEGYGNVTVSNGAGDVTVAHQLAGLPQVVVVCPSWDTDGWHLTTVNATHFIVDWDTNPASDQWLSWYANYTP